MKWTSEVPTVDGIYWYRNLTHRKSDARPLYFYAQEEDDQCVRYARFSHNGKHSESWVYAQEEGDEWSDTPIPEPGVRVFNQDQWKRLVSQEAFLIRALAHLAPSEKLTERELRKLPHTEGQVDIASLSRQILDYWHAMGGDTPIPEPEEEFVFQTDQQYGYVLHVGMRPLTDEDIEGCKEFLMRNSVRHIVPKQYIDQVKWIVIQPNPDDYGTFRLGSVAWKIGPIETDGAS